MYENVWVEADKGREGPPLPPRVLRMSGVRRAEETSRETKTGRLEEIFTSRKMSQESLASHNSHGSNSGIRCVTETFLVTSENVKISKARQQTTLISSSIFVIIIIETPYYRSQASKPSEDRVYWIRELWLDHGDHPEHPGGLQHQPREHLRRPLQLQLAQEN